MGEVQPRQNRFGGATKLTIDTTNLSPDTGSRSSTLSNKTPQDTCSSTHSSNGKKRRRRKASQIERKYACTYAGCNKAYGSEGSLNQHTRLKHRTMSLDRAPPCHQQQMSPILPALPNRFNGTKSPLLTTLLHSSVPQKIPLPLEGQRAPSKSFCFGSTSLSMVPEISLETPNPYDYTGSKSVPVSPAVAALSEMTISTPKQSIIYPKQSIPPLSLNDTVEPLNEFLSMDNLEPTSTISTDEKEIMDYLLSLDSTTDFDPKLETRSNANWMIDWDPEELVSYSWDGVGLPPAS